MHVRRIQPLTLLLGLSAACLVAKPSSAQVIYSTGFENSDGFTLNSALPSSPATASDWYRIDGSPTVTTLPNVDITSTNNGGSQGLRVQNQGTFNQSDPNANTFVESPVINLPSSSNLIANNTPSVLIKWDMRVDDAANASNDSFYIGLDVFDALGDGIATVARQVQNGTPALIGTNSNGDVVLTPSLGDAPASGVWASYTLSLDFNAQTYALLVNGIQMGAAQPFTTGAEDSLDIDFTDAGRGLDTAYFDNFSVTLVPEPIGAGLMAAGIVAGLMRRRRTV